MGVLILKERLRPVQWTAVGVGFAAVVVLTVGYGQPPWISLCLAFSFATYGLVKKKVSLGGIESLAAETAVQFVPALVYLLCSPRTDRPSLPTAPDTRRCSPRPAWSPRCPSSASAPPRSACRCPPWDCSSTWRRSSSSCWHPLLPRGDAARALGRLRAGLDRPGAADLGRAAHGPPDGPRTQGGLETSGAIVATGTVGATRGRTTWWLVPTSRWRPGRRPGPSRRRPADVGARAVSGSGPLRFTGAGRFTGGGDTGPIGESAHPVAGLFELVEVVGGRPLGGGEFAPDLDQVTPRCSPGSGRGRHARRRPRSARSRTRPVSRQVGGGAGPAPARDGRNAGRRGQ